MLKPGDSWDKGATENGYPVPYNPSYFSPAHFKLFAAASGNARWSSMVTAGYGFMTSKCAAKFCPGSGLVPDWAYSATDCTPGSKYLSWVRDNGADYYYDAIRTPWRLALDASWNCDATGKSLTSQMANYFQSKGPYGIQQGFTPSCGVIQEGENLCFVATAATAMVPAQSSGVVNSWWSTTLNEWNGRGVYFCDTLMMLAETYMAGLMVAPVL